jgi:alpha-1,2-mannosyltransferase
MSDAMRSRRQRGGARHRLLVWGGTLLCLGWLSHGLEVATPGLETRSGAIKGADYIQFYVMGSLIREGRARFLYDSTAIEAEARRRISPRLEHHAAYNPYGPQVALAFEPLARMPFLTSFAVFSVLSTCSYVAAVWLLWRQAPRLAGEGGYVVLVAAAFPALLVSLRFGQISTFTLLAVAGAVAALGADRRFIGGACLGLLAYKPQLLVVLLPMLVLARDWRSLGGVVTSSAAQCGTAWVVAGTEAMQRYVQTLTNLALHPDLVMLYQENSHSLRGFLRLLGVPPGWATAVVVAAVVACTPAIARAWRATPPPLVRVSLLVLPTILLAPHLLTYDLLLLGVPILALADWTTAHPQDRGARSAVLLAVALYLAAFSPVLAAHFRVQLSTVMVAAAAWFVWCRVRGTAPEANRGEPIVG